LIRRRPHDLGSIRTSFQLRVEEAHLGVVAQRIERAGKQLPRPRQVAPKIGRNDRCPCGSGLKYKQCHGLAGGPVR
jgi:uncharacterized protein YecA (UPF0149 family)